MPRGESRGPSFSSMIAVTGASGFLGRHLVRRLQEEKIDFVSLPRPFLQNSQRIAGALQGVTDVLHLAGKVNGSTVDIQEANVGLMRRLVEGAKQAGVKRIIFTSSVAAQYRLGPYGQAKAEAEEILKVSGISYLIFRSSLIYGTGDAKNVAMMESVLRRYPLVPLLGGGNFLIQPVYVDDAVELLIKGLQSPAMNRTYNLAGPAQIALKEMLQILGESLGKKPCFLPLPLKPVQAAVRIYSSLFPNTKLPVKQILDLNKHERFDISETQKDFGFLPRNFRDGVRAMREAEQLCAG